MCADKRMPVCCAPDLLEEGGREQGGFETSAPGAAYVTAMLEARKEAAAQMAKKEAPAEQRQVG